MKYFLFLLALLFAVHYSYAQNLSGANVLPNVIPPSPDAAALGKYGDIAVDKGTGAPNISIPIYTIKTTHFNLPVFLSYDASGIKVDQMSTWVGLGWSLNASGVITRTIVGKPDENNNGSLNNLTLPDMNNIQYPQDYNTLDQMIVGNHDYDPDYYFFNFNGHTGKFIFGQDHNPLQISSSPIKISYISATNSFSVTDEKGDIYIFNNKENVLNSFITQYGQNSFNIAASSGVTSWYLSQITSADQTETVNFNYTQETNPLYEYGYTYSQVIGASNNTPSQACNSLTMAEPLGYSQNTRSYTPLRLSSITFTGGKVSFASQSGRQDQPGLTALSNVLIYTYDSASQTYNEIKNVQLITSQFHTDVQNLINSQLTNLQYRMRLDQVVEKDVNESQAQVYSFDYNTLTLPPVNNFAQDTWGYYNGKTNNNSLLQTQTVPNESGVGVTVGDGDRSIDVNFMQAGMLTDIHYPTKGYTHFNYEPHQYVYSYHHPVTVSAYASAVAGTQESNSYTFTPINPISGSITVNISNYNNLSPPVLTRPFVKLVNLTTGKTIYASDGDPNKVTLQTIPFFSNNYLVSGQQYQLTATASGNPTVYATIGVTYQYYTDVPQVLGGGGLRIASIENYDAGNSLLSTKTYKYGANESGLGVTISPTFALVPNVTAKSFSYGISNIGSGVTCFQCYTQRNIYSSSSSYELSTLSGSPIAYDAITEYNGKIDNNSGKTISEYDLFVDASYPVLPYYQNGVMLTPNSWRNGQLKREVQYLNRNGQYIPLHEKQVDFFINPGPQGLGMKVGYTSVFSGCRSPSPNDYYYFTYPIFTGVKLPNQITENDYDASGQNITTQNVTKYYYDNLDHLQPTQKTVSSSTGDTWITQYKYPHDFAGQEPYATMVNTTHIWSPVIEQLDYKNSISTSNFLQSTKKDYSFWSSGLPTTTSTNQIYPLTVSTQTGAGAYEPRIQYLGYDDKGNVQSVSKNLGPKIAYLWGYNRAYPIAQVSNATYQDMVNVLGQSVINQLAGATSADDASVRNTLSTLRTSLPGAQVTTYTYKPLVGMTSMTDARGNTTYYEYDNFQRLSNIKDQYGNIKTHYCYNYAGQQKDCTIPTGPPVYAKMTVSNTTTGQVGSYTHTYKNYAVQLYSNQQCTIPYTAVSDMQVSYRVLTTVNNIGTVYNDYTPFITVPQGSSGANTDAIDVAGCYPNSESLSLKAGGTSAATSAGSISAQKSPTGTAIAQPNSLPTDPNATCVTSTVNLQPGTGYIPVL